MRVKIEGRERWLPNELPQPEIGRASDFVKNGLSNANTSKASRAETNDINKKSFMTSSMRRILKSILAVLTTLMLIKTDVRGVQQEKKNI